MRVKKIKKVLSNFIPMDQRINIKDIIFLIMNTYNPSATLSQTVG